MKKLILSLLVLLGMSCFAVQAQEHACTYTIVNNTDRVAWLDIHPEKPAPKNGAKVFIPIKPNDTWAVPCKVDDKEWINSMIAILPEISKPECLDKGNSVRFLALEPNVPVIIIKWDAPARYSRQKCDVAVTANEG